jgi:hypothetical protein
VGKFLELVQQHERDWGNEVYTGRPQLADLLSAPVVVFWQPAKANNKDKRLMVSLHNDVNMIEKYLTRLIMLGHSNPPDRRYVTAFMNQREVKVKSVKIEFAFIDESTR